jgi:phospholipid/cholesterol/gamma-HCH transport system permease protein
MPLTKSPGVIDGASSNPLSRFGERLLGIFDQVGEFVLLAGDTTAALLRHRPPGLETLRQLEEVMVRSAPLVAVTALFTGMVLSLQTAYSLTRFGAKPYVGAVVGLALVRELGPVLAALMVGARVGAGIASELGSMKVTEQVDAIRAMGADPVQKLVVPRVIATTLGLPVLTVFAILLGVVGGGVVADLQYNISTSFYTQTVTNIVRIDDFLSGVAKTFVFGWGIGMVSCWVGLRASGGTAGVGRATTEAVVISAIGVLVSDFFLTKLLMLLPTEEWIRALGALFG